MPDSKTEFIEVYKFEKQLKVFVSVFLSVLILSLVAVLVTFEISPELQQVLVVVLGLLCTSAVNAFSKSMETVNFPTNELTNKIIIGKGGFYVEGNLYQGDINNATEKRQSLADAAVEIHQLLQQLNELNPTATEDEKANYLEISADPELKSQLTNLVMSDAVSVEDVAVEIQKYIQQIEGSAERKTNSKVVNSLREQPRLTARLSEALQAGGEEALDGLLDNAYVRIIQAVIQGWVSTEETEK